MIGTAQGVTAEDIVTRLRKQADRIGLLLTDPPQETVDGALMREAAAEIASLKQRLESAEKTMRAIALEAHETIPPDGKEAAFVALHSIGKMVSGYFSAIQEQEKQNG